MKIVAAQNLPWCSYVISFCCSHQRNWQIVALLHAWEGYRLFGIGRRSCVDKSLCVGG